MEPDPAGERLSFLGRQVGPACVVREVVVAPGSERPYREAEWRDALVIVERGEIEVEALCGDRWSFASGAVLWLVGLPLRVLRNHGPEAVLIVAVSRARFTPQRRAPADPATPAADRRGTS
jgi:quercetin dioxygenase-like cupin family protein